MAEVEAETEMDPMGAAVAAKAITDSANAVAKNSIFQALFLPTAKAYGDHWGAETRSRLKDAAERKKHDNLAAHLTAVKPHVGTNFRPDPELTDDWMRGAETVDPVDEELSMAWHAALLAIGSGNPYRQRMLDTVKALSPDEAKALMAIARRGARDWSDRSGLHFDNGQYQPQSLGDYRARLEVLGLVRGRWEMLSGPRVVSAGLAGMMLLLVTFAARAVYFFPLAVDLPVRAEQVDALLPVALCMVIAAVVLVVTRSVAAISLTGFGRALVAAVAAISVARENAAADRSGEAPVSDAPAKPDPGLRRRANAERASAQKKGTTPIRKVKSSDD